MENNERIKESYIPEGTCAKNFVFDVHKDENGDFVFDEFRMFGGKCSGSAKMLTKLAAGKKIDDLIPEFKQILCSNCNSCYQELAKALELFLQKQNGIKPVQVSFKRKKPLDFSKEN